VHEKRGGSQVARSGKEGEQEEEEFQARRDVRGVCRWLYEKGKIGEKKKYGCVKGVRFVAVPMVPTCRDRTVSRGEDEGGDSGFLT